jgi:Skp family chaperone for outer membrane proteins
MKRWSVLVAAVAALGVAFVAGAAISPGVAKPAGEKKPDEEKAVGHKTAVFNMAAVMRDFQLAKYNVWRLNNKKMEMSKKMLGWREEYVRLQQDLQKNPTDPKKDEKSRKMLDLARKIEDADREINKQLNDDASAIIADLHDKIKVAVDRVADEFGFQLVLAYPDAVTPEEARSPYIKELKLKPPAAQPFYVDPEIDVTARVVKALNKKHPPIDPDTKKPVDVSKLDVPPPPPAVPNVPGPAPQIAPPTTPLPRVPSPNDGP